MRLAEVPDMTAISTLVVALKQELAVPGTFEDVFPDTGTADLVSALANGFAEAQLMRFFPDTILAESGQGATKEWTSSPDLSLAGGALVVIVTSMRFIRAQLRNLNTSERYKAGATEFEVQRAATVLVQELRYLQKRLDDLIKNADGAANASAGLVNVYDSYVSRGGSLFHIGGFYHHEYR